MLEVFQKFSHYQSSIKKKKGKVKIGKWIEKSDGKLVLMVFVIDQAISYVFLVTIGVIINQFCLYTCKYLINLKTFLSPLINSHVFIPFFLLLLCVKFNILLYPFIHQILLMAD